MASNQYVAFPSTTLFISKRRLDKLYGDGPPHWVEGKTGRPAKTVNQAIGQRVKDIRRLRKAEHAQAEGLADQLASCCPAYPCGSAACAVCWRAFQRLFVRAGRPLKPRYAGPMSAVSIVLGGKIPLGELGVAHFMAASAAVREALIESGIRFAAGGLDVNINEDSKDVPPYWALQAWLIVPKMAPEQESQLRKALEKHRGKVSVLVHVQDFDGDNAGLAYAQKGDFDRRQTVPAHNKDDGSHIRQNTRDRHLKVEQEVELLIVRHELAFKVVCYSTMLGSEGMDVSDCQKPDLAGC